MGADCTITAISGNIIETLTSEFTATLTSGEHTLGIVSASRTAKTTFTVTSDTPYNTVSDNSTDNNSD